MKSVNNKIDETVLDFSGEPSLYAKAVGGNDPIPRYVLDVNQKVINVGDVVEMKQTDGGYGRTKTITGEVLEITQLGQMKIKDVGFVNFHKDYDFNNSRKYDKYILKTSNTHGFGAMDVHAHEVYVKILKKK